MSLLDALLLAVIAAYAFHMHTTRKRSRLPPGPPGWPLIGNLLQLPAKLPFLQFHAWAQEYGPLVSFHILSQPVVVINDLHVAADILDRMSGVTGDRPQSIKAGDYLTRGRSIGHMPRTELWRQMRKATHEGLNMRNTPFSIQEQEAAILVRDMLQYREVELERHVHRLAGSIGLRTLYGGSSIPLHGEDPSERLEELAYSIFAAMLPGRSLVDIFPPLRHIISRSKWLRRTADSTYETITSGFLQYYYSESEEGRECLSTILRDPKNNHGMSDVNSAWLLGILFSGSKDTSAIALCYVILAMLLHPEYAKTAQKELDAVLGDRPPTFEDQSQLPYIEAIVKEVMRWRPPAPASLPNSNSEDIQYRDYLIPKGTMIIPNLWTMSRDLKIYPDGDTFNPGRFLTPDGCIRQPPPDTHEDWLAFGHGRRACAGRNVGIRTVWICAAYLLWAFDFQKAKGEDGEEITPSDMDFVDNGIAVYPAPFKLRVVPRFADLVERLQQHDVRMKG